MGRGLGLVAALLALALPGSARAAIGIEHPDGPDPVVSAWPSWPLPASCGGLAFDPVSAFGGTTEAQNGIGGPELALKRYIDEGLRVQTPREYWRVLAATETRVEFASGLLSVRPFWLSFELTGGEWRSTDEIRTCRARTIREGRTAVGWRLAPGEEIEAGTRRIEVKLSHLGCHGKTPLADLAGRPSFWQRGRRLSIGIWLDRLGPGPHTCPRPKETEPLAIELPGRLGDRVLFDGGTYPPERRGWASRSSRLRQ